MKINYKYICTIREFMYNFVDFDQDKIEARQKFLKEMNKKATLADIDKAVPYRILNLYHILNLYKILNILKNLVYTG